MGNYGSAVDPEFMQDEQEQEITQYQQTPPLPTPATWPMAQTFGVYQNPAPPPRTIQSPPVPRMIQQQPPPQQSITPIPQRQPVISIPPPQRQPIAPATFDPIFIPDTDVRKYIAKCDTTTYLATMATIGRGACVVFGDAEIQGHAGKLVAIPDLTPRPLGEASDARLKFTDKKAMLIDSQFVISISAIVAGIFVDEENTYIKVIFMTYSPKREIRSKMLTWSAFINGQFNESPQVTAALKTAVDQFKNERPEMFQTYPR